MKIINLTPHTLNIFDVDGNEIIVPRIETSEGRFLCLRCETVVKSQSILHNIQVTQSAFGDLEVGTVAVNGMDFAADSILTIPTDGDIYVVSMLCLSALQGHNYIFNIHENRFYSPGSLLRNDNNQPIGCKGLSKL